jgi:hypothetical protein
MSTHIAAGFASLDRSAFPPHEPDENTFSLVAKASVMLADALIAALDAKG